LSNFTPHGAGTGKSLQPTGGLPRAGGALGADFANPPLLVRSKSMAGDYSKAATALRGKAVLADVDATVEESLAKRYNIEGFPTLKLFQNGGEVIDYTGDRDYDSMVKFIEGAKKPAYESVATASEYAAFAEENKGIDVVVGLGLDGAARLVLTKASFALRDLFPDSLAYLSLKDASASKDVAGLAKGDFALLRSGGGEVEAIKFDAKKHKSLESFVKTAAVPAFGEFSQENADLYTELTTPLIVGFFDRAAKDEDPNMAISRLWRTRRRTTGRLCLCGSTRRNSRPSRSTSASRTRASRFAGTPL
jgi:protein disulfide-isomerase A1